MEEKKVMPFGKNMRADIVTCEKESRWSFERTFPGLVSKRKEEVFIFTLENGEKAKTGDWIVLDVCDNWHTMPNGLYEIHKDDEIQDT